MAKLRKGMIGLAALSGITLAATMAKADGVPAAEPAYYGLPPIWSGLYGGAHIGYANARYDDGFVGGVQLGYNWQANAIVYGVEGDISFADADSIDWLASARGRLGYLIQPNLLLYGTAGIGGSDDVGFVYGAGLETQLSYSTTGRIEFLEYDSDHGVGVFRAALNFKLGP
jgi:outer membrane immunogenic protein